MKTKIARNFLLFFAMLLGAWLALYCYMPTLVERQIHTMADKCSTCTVSVERVRVGPFFSTLELTHFRLKQGLPHTTEISAEIESITAHLVLRDLLHRDFHLRDIVFQHPFVLIREGDSDAKAPAREAKKTTHWDFTINQGELVGGNFTYEREHGQKRSGIHLHEIHGTIGLIDSREPAQNNISAGEAHGVLEKTGNFILRLKIPLFQAPEQAEVDLEVFHANLAEINEYFEAEQSLKLQGELLQGHSHVNLAANKIEAWTEMKYKDFDLHFEKGRQHSALSAFFENIAKRFSIHAADLKKNRNEQAHGVVITRQDESLVAFVLRGMRTAAEKVITR